MVLGVMTHSRDLARTSDDLEKAFAAIAQEKVRRALLVFSLIPRVQQ